MDIHLEFCNKYQNDKFGEYQLHFMDSPQEPVVREPEQYNSDCWSRDIDDSTIVTKMMGGMNLKARK